MFLEALKQFIYGWIFKWIKDNLSEAEDKYAQKVIKRKIKESQK